MPWPYGTRPKTGAPSSIHIEDDQWNVLFAPLGLPTGLLALFLGAFSSVDLDVATMCATEPPPQETFTVGDFYRFLDPTTHDAAEAKIRRIATAAQWNTVCEYIPAPPPAAGPYPLWTETALNRHVGPNETAADAVDSGTNTYAGADMYLILFTQAAGATAQVFLELHHPDGTISPRLAPPDFLAVNPFADTIQNGQDLGGTPPFVFDAVNDTWHVRNRANNAGTCDILVVGYKLTDAPIIQPAVPDPWVLVPAEAAPYQFSDECATDLCALAAWLPNLQNHTIAADLNTQQLLDRPGTDLTELNDRLTDVQGHVSNNEYGLTQLLAAIGGTTGRFVQAPVTIADGEELNVEGTCGAIITWTPGDGVWSMTYGHPNKSRQVGYVTWGTALAWYDPEDLVVSPQFVGGWPQTTTRLAVSLMPGGTATVSRIYAGHLP